MWDRQVSLWPGEKVTPLDVCDPEMAAHARGYDYREGLVDDLGSQAGRYELAGFIDRSRRLIAVSDKYNLQIRRFTAAHELGHLELHPGLHHHRERPMAGPTEPSEPTDPIERQANHFAGCFLVPRKQLVRAFRAYFKLEQLKLTDTVAYELVDTSFRALLAADSKSLSFERAVAQTPRFQGRHFDPLHKLFRVSATTMAIRLRQVGLVLA
jgi:IrrE N-terminal-like domain